MDDNEEIQEKCGVSQMPTFQFYKEGEKLYEFTGNKPDMLKLKMNFYNKRSSPPSAGGDAGPAAKRQKPNDAVPLNACIVIGATKPPHFSMGPGTYEVPMTMHADNRARLAAAMREKGAVGKLPHPFL